MSFWARKQLANRIGSQSKPTDGIELETRRKSNVQIVIWSVFIMVPLMFAARQHGFANACSQDERLSMCAALSASNIMVSILFAGMWVTRITVFKRFQQCVLPHQACSCYSFDEACCRWSMLPESSLSVLQCSCLNHERNHNTNASVCNLDDAFPSGFQFDSIRRFALQSDPICQPFPGPKTHLRNWLESLRKGWWNEETESLHENPDFLYSGWGVYRFLQ